MHGWWGTQDLADFWRGYIVENLKVGEFRSTDGSAELAPLVFGVQTALWSTACSKKGGEERVAAGPRSSRAVHGEVARR